MKVIGYTESGGAVVELTAQETNELKKLTEAILGRPMNSFYAMNDEFHPERCADFHGVFGAIRAFSIAKFQVNNMRSVLEMFDAHLGVKP